MKVLHLEDNPQDAELTRLVLAKEWPSLEVQVVDTRDGFVAQLEATPDLILSDFGMPNFSGLDALSIARERAPATPFIFFSGTIGEERAIDALRSGASDYVIKDRPQRLVPAVRRAMVDATRRREREIVEANVAEVRRLENVRQMIYAIAHDLNNALAPIMMGSSYLQRKVLPEDQALCAAIGRCSEKGAALVKEITAFSSDASGTPGLLALRPAIGELVVLLQQSFPGNITVRADIAEDLWPATIHRAHLHQIIFNLCLQSRATIGAKHGVMRIRAHNSGGLPAIPGGPADLGEGKYVLIEIADTGAGISPEACEAVLPPPEKPIDRARNAALELATVRALVARYKGVLTVSALPGWGTTYRIFLPVGVSPG